MSRTPGLGGIGRGKPVNLGAYAAQQAPPGGYQQTDGPAFQVNQPAGLIQGQPFGQGFQQGGGGQPSSYNQGGFQPPVNQGYGQGNAYGQPSSGYGQPAGYGQQGAGGFGHGGSQSAGNAYGQGSEFGQQSEGSWAPTGQQDGFGYQQSASVGAGRGGSGQSGGFGRGGGYGSRTDGGGRNASSDTCRNCGQPGHFARECNVPRSDRPRARGCYKCGDLNHIARDCTDGGQGHNQNSGGGGFDNSSGNQRGFHSDGFGGGGGHEASNGFGGGGFGGGGFSSSGYGGSNSDHSDALPPRGRGRGGGGGRECFNCGDTSHISRECSKPRSNERCPGGRSDKCYRCNETGHMADTCSASVQFDSTKKPASKYVPEEASVDDLWKEHIKTGIHFDRYYHIPVEATGTDNTAESIKTFDAAGLPPQLLDNVRKAGYEVPTPIQQYAIPYILAERDLMACAQTGSGKTAAFLLPILAAMMNNQSLMDTIPGDRQNPVVVVMAPTRELAIQIKDEARKFSANTNAKVVAVYGGTSVWGQKATLRPGCNICIATPGRLLDFVDKGVIGLTKCKYLVLDEADRMLDMGFEQEVRRLVQHSDMPPKTERQTLMFSATFPVAIQQLATEFLNDHIFITVGKVGAANMDIVQEVILVKDSGEKKDLVLKYVLESVNASKDENGKYHKKTMIFVQRKRIADYLAIQLCGGGDEGDPNSSGVKATSLHGDRAQNERELVFHQFKSGDFPVLVATDVAARGLDIQEVDHVINYDMPSDITDYVHRIGRTARVGNIGMSTSFFDVSTDMAIAKDLVKVLADAQQQVPEWLQDLAQTGSYNPSGTEAEASQSDEPW